MCLTFYKSSIILCRYYEIADESKEIPSPKKKLSLRAQCENLPIYAAKNQLLNKIASLPTTILIGETGSGKTTQIPQVKILKMPFYCPPHLRNVRGVLKWRTSMDVAGNAY